MDKDQYIAERLDLQIDWYDRKSVNNQHLFKWLQVTVIVLSTSIPLLSGYIDNDIPVIGIIVGGLGGMVTVLTSVHAIFQFNNNWLTYRATCELLQHEKYLFLAGAAPYDEENAFELLVERVEGIMSQENSNWREYMKHVQHGSNTG